MHVCSHRPRAETELVSDDFVRERERQERSDGSFPFGQSARVLLTRRILVRDDETLAVALETIDEGVASFDERTPQAQCLFGIAPSQRTARALDRSDRGAERV